MHQPPASGETLSTLAQQAAEIESLRAGMATREIIGRATGLLMARHGIDGDDAFAMLTRESSRQNRKLRELAIEMVRDANRAALESRAAEKLRLGLAPLVAPRPPAPRKQAARGRRADLGRPLRLGAEAESVG